MKISVADFCPKEALSLPLQPVTGEEVGRRVGFSVTGRVVGVRVGFGMRAQALNRAVVAIFAELEAILNRASGTFNKASRTSFADRQIL